MFAFLTSSVFGQAANAPVIHSPEYARAISGSVPIQITSTSSFDVFIKKGAPGITLWEEIHVFHSDSGVNNTTVVTINSSDYESGQYTIRVVDDKGNEATTSFLIDNLAKQEWITSDARNFTPYNGLLKAVDFEGDNIAETVFIDIVEENVELVVLNAAGDLVFNTPIAVSASFDYWQLPIVTELDSSNPNKELVLVRREIIDGDSFAIVEIFSSTGILLRSEILSHPHEYLDSYYLYRETLELAVGNIDGNSGEEIVVVDQDTLYILDAQLNELASYTTEANDPDQLVIAPLDAEEGADVVIRSKRCEDYVQGANGQFYCSALNYTHFLQAFNLDGELWLREFEADEMFAVDIDRDFTNELILVHGQYIYRLDGQGEFHQGDSWPVQSNEYYHHKNLMVAPIQNGVSDVYLTAMWEYTPTTNWSQVNLMRYINHYGENINTTNINIDGAVGRPQSHRIAVANLDGDEEWEYFVTTMPNKSYSYNKEVYAIDDNGAAMEGGKFRAGLKFNYYDCDAHPCYFSFYHTPLITDIDNDGFLDVSTSGDAPLGFYWQSSNLPVESENMAWGTALYDEKNQNYFKVKYADKNFDQVYFRGTPNNFSTKGMNLVDDHLWEIKVNFLGAPTDKFKFDIYGDWGLNYGDVNRDGIADLSGADIYVENGGGDYIIQFNDETLEYSVVATGENRPPLYSVDGDVVVHKNELFFVSKNVVIPDFFARRSPTSSYLFSVSEPGYYLLPTGNGLDEQLIIVKDYENARFDKVYFRSTTNDWSKTEMRMVKPGVWELGVYVDDSRDDHSFKFDIHGDWSYNFGDNNLDGIGDQWGSNIPLGYQGHVLIRFYENSLAYEVLPERPHVAYVDFGMGEFPIDVITVLERTIDSVKVLSKSLGNSPMLRAEFDSNSGASFHNWEQLDGDDVMFGRNTNSYGYPWMDFVAPGNGEYVFEGTYFKEDESSDSLEVTFIIEESLGGTSNIQFACHNASIDDGYGVYVVGNDVRLGDWEPTRYNRLKDFGKGIWGKTIEGFAEQSDIEWKCVIAKDETLGNIQWESGGNNQVTAPAEGGVITSRGYF